MRKGRHPAVLTSAGAGLGVIVACLTIWTQVRSMVREHRDHDQQVSQAIYELQQDVCRLKGGEWWRGECRRPHR